MRRRNPFLIWDHSPVTRRVIPVLVGDMKSPTPVVLRARHSNVYVIRWRIPFSNLTFVDVFFFWIICKIKYFFYFFVMGSCNQTKRLRNLQNLKSGAIKLPRHWSKMLGLVNIRKASIEEILQVSCGLVCLVVWPAGWAWSQCSLRKRALHGVPTLLSELDINYLIHTYA